MSDDDFDEESFAAYENELYGEKSGSDSDVESEVEDALYSQLHYSFSQPDEDNPEDDKDEAESEITTYDDNIVDSGKLPIIIISDDDDDVVDTTDIVCNVNDSQNVVEESSHDLSQENWDLIEEDMGDELRGKGGAARYYAPNSASSHKRCRNCNEKGHLAKNCPIPKKISCVLCGTPGHTRFKCPNQLCFNCSQPGHRSFECEEFRVRWTDQCRRCYQNGHHSNRCPDIWRQYHRTTVEGIPPVPAENSNNCSSPMYCYNCSANGHYGYECPEERPMDHVACSTVQYIVRYDGHYHRPFMKTSRSENQNRTNDREEEYRNRTLDREKESRYRTPDRGKKYRSRTSDQYEDDYRNRTPAFNQDIKEYGNRRLNREKGFRNRTLDQDNETPRNKNRKRAHDWEEDSTIEDSKRRKSWPSKERKDFRIDDIETPQKGSKKKKNKKKKTRNTEECLVTFVSRKEKKKKGWKNNTLRTVEYFTDQSLPDQPLTRTVELVNPRKEKGKDNLMRIVDDWEEMNGNQTRGNQKSSHKTKHKKQAPVPIPPRQERSWLPGSFDYSQNDSSPGPNVQRRGHDLGRSQANFMIDLQGKKWPNKKTSKSARGFRSKKKSYTL